MPQQYDYNFLAILATKEIKHCAKTSLIVRNQRKTMEDWDWDHYRILVCSTVCENLPCKGVIIIIMHINLPIGALFLQCRERELSGEEIIIVDQFNFYLYKITK